ncbi:glycosyltransferase family 4 protein [Nocardia cyriacigeorgica]|uniref:glycosyltransferase family 4 protein n=1 Tax=Nocardia cyriacigeorgica TaxID=135487 RepID=UPI0024569AD9|nr:glycosyltransferase family 1 protein [Nocardia cyriacigeorgica]
MSDRALRVAIDARYWRATIQTGVERYIHLLTDALAATGEKVEIAVVLTAEHAAGYPRAQRAGIRVLTVPDRREHHLHRQIEHFDADLVHYPFALPAALPRPAVFTLHDAGRYLFPDQMVRAVRDVQNPRLHTLLAGEDLRAVITVSHAARADIVGALGDLGKPLEIVPNYVATDFAHQLRTADPALAPSEPFLFGVGVYMPSKNIPRLIRAFRLARAAVPDRVPARLLLAGRRGWERGLPVRDPEITILGHIGDDQLAALYRAATAFVFPTLFEGFGIPAQEALVAGTPLLCSDLPVLREVTGGLAARYTDPHDEEILAKNIIAVCDAEPADHDAVTAHLSNYTAESVGHRLLEVYRQAAAAS